MLDGVRMVDEGGREAPRRVPGPEDEGDEPGKLRWKVVALGAAAHGPARGRKGSSGQAVPLALQHGSETDVAGVREGEHAPHEALLGPRGLLEGEDPLHPSPTLPKEPDNLGEGAVHAGEGPPLDGTDAVAHQALEYSDNVFVAKGVVDVVPAVPADASLGSGAHASLGCVAHASL